MCVHTVCVCYINFNCVIVIAVPRLLSVRRISGSSATVKWIPLTQDEVRGLLTSLEIAYQPVLNTTLNCSNSEFVDSETVSVRDNLFEQNSANITGLEPNREYCIALQVRTSGGESGFSSSIKLSCKMFHKLLLIISKLHNFLTVPEGIPFQIKFGFPNDSESNCFNFVVRNCFKFNQ